MSAIRGLIAGLSPTPDLRGTRSMIWLALAVAATACALLVVRTGALHGYGDTDDAMRLVIVRDLVAGRGWFDQSIPRLHPPQGAWLHWSRLLDGGIAGLILLFRGFAAPGAAEYWARYAWPLLWLFPAIAAALAIARNLGARSAPFLTALLMLVHFQLYRQFVPGRIDHHNIQITMTVVALACALATKNRTRWALGAGVAAGLGLAIGLEALPFQAVIGAGYGVALARDRKAGGPAIAYGLALAATTTLLFAIETPPWRWSMPFCDAVGPNLVAAVAVAGLGLALAGAVAGRAPAWARLGLMAAAALAAGGVYLALDPECLHGPFAAMDPAVRPFWFDRIQEVQPLPRMLGLEHRAAITAIAMLVVSIAAAAFLVARQWRSPSTASLLVAALLAIACAIADSAWRMQDYVFWIGLPAMGAALSYLASRFLKDLMVPSAAAALLLSPIVWGAMGHGAARAVARPGPAPVNAGPRCFSPRAYGELARLPPGDVLAVQDLGPFILVSTPQSVVVAPYHRMSHEILAAHLAFDAPAAEAESRVRALGADYVVDCPPYQTYTSAGSLNDLLRTGGPPPWLERVSRPGAVLTIYRLRPPAPTG